MVPFFKDEQLKLRVKMLHLFEGGGIQGFTVTRLKTKIIFLKHIIPNEQGTLVWSEKEEF